MADKHSAGVLPYRAAAGPDSGLEVLLGHMGGPFWARRDTGAWTVIKGEYRPDEPAQDAARREFGEELGLPLPEGPLESLGETRQAGGKVVVVWALRTDLDPALIVPGTFTMEWPKGSGVVREFPEIDRAAWLPLPRAYARIVTAQRVFLDRLATLAE
jgi:predicted NUDIX family NTP pyrophosphohydrolase